MNPTARVSAIVPARNEEANIERVVTSLAAQPEIAEVIVVNDQSTDRTTEILAALAARIPHLRVLETRELPPGWIGKNYAVSLGAAQAKCPWLLFTDADTFHLPGSTGRALADAEQHSADLVSYSPEQETPTWWERAMIPFVYCRLAHHYPYAGVGDSHSNPAVNGQYILVRREAYQTFGGHQAVRGEILEDVALARRATEAGLKIYFAPGQGITRTRMYRSFPEMWRGWTKNLYALIGRRPAAAVRELVDVSLWPVLVLLLLSMPHWAWRVLASLALLRAHAAYGAELRRNRYPVSRILYYLPAVFLYSAALVASAWCFARGAVSWKGRAYPVGTR